MKKNLILLYLLLVIAGVGFAQSGDLLRVMQPSPTSREFEKYITQQVSLYNGIPEINIPLYNLQVGKESIPIMLKYHASGIKFGQSSGEVGVGWVLEPGYRISRTMYGRPDEYFPMPANLDAVNSISDPATRDIYLAQFGRDNEMYLPYAAQSLDGEYDKFSYSLGSTAGMFIITDRQLRQVKTTSTTLDAISYAQSSQGMITNFDIKDGNGISYRFGKELTGGNVIYERNSSVNFTKGITPSAWLLTDMVDPFGQYARFHYKNYQESNSNTGKSLYTMASVTGSDGMCPNTTGDANLNSVPLNVYEVQALMDITTEREVVKFYRKANTTIIDSITVNLITGQRLKKFVFQYVSTALHRFLDKVIVYGSKDIDGQTYSFNYINRDYPGNGSLIADYWGYYRQTSNNYYEFPDFGSLYLCKGELGVVSLGTYMTMTDRNSYGADASFFTLSKITYPTGGSTSFEYESNKYWGANDNNGMLAIKNVGIRIKKIWFNDLVRNETMMKEYRYGTTDDETGQVSVDLANKNLFISEAVFGDCLLYGPSQADVRLLRTVTFKTNPDEELAVAAASPVVYSKVTETSRGINSVNGLAEYNGKTEYYYLLPEAIYYQGYPVNSSYMAYDGLMDGFGADCINMGAGAKYLLRKYPAYYVSLDASWKKPVLKSKKVYKYVNGIYEPQLFEESEYVSNMEMFPGLKVRKFFSASENYNSSSNYYAYGITSLFDYGSYSVSCGDQVLSRTVSTYFSNGSQLQRERKLSYNSLLQVNKEETVNSDNTKTIAYNYYPRDYGVITGTDPISSGVKKLLESHILTATIENTLAKTDIDGSNERVIKSNFNSFKSNMPLQDGFWTFNDGSGVTNFSRTTTINGAVNLDPRYQYRLSFNSYDSRGNILEQQKVNDIAEVYIWGYNNQYPVAKISGGNYVTSIGQLNQAILQNPANDQQLREELNKLRINSLDGKILVSTYTYAPSVGVTSETDPAGRTSYYEYDESGRLKLIRDAHGNIVKQYDYKYQQPLTQ
ncbi:RHS repeat domain-containing protein [Chitinophaga sp. sic0106]|uniref:RHS repeat domain-containing protein n=1 Tax=Chitinophaga sp. sic0106 TaxID=2854785 RepID=UPI001C47B911|nr:RHS repeat domain-containing protein [Chitinophaga sp. sic0106]MBV7533988.1 RHS repeat protein [Chitinophaga sp. sic0106]